VRLADCHKIGTPLGKVAGNEPVLPIFMERRFPGGTASGQAYSLTCTRGIGAFSEWRVIHPESGSLGYSAHLKRSVSESAVLQQSSRPPAILIDTSTLPSLDSSNE